MVAENSNDNKTYVFQLVACLQFVLIEFIISQYHLAVTDRRFQDTLLRKHGYYQELPFIE